MSASTSTATAGCGRLVNPMTRSPEQRAISSSEANTDAASTGVMRFEAADRIAAGTATPPGMPAVCAAPMASRFRIRSPRRDTGRRCAVGRQFLLGQNFYAVRSYNPSMNYTLAIVHLSDRLRGGGPFVQGFPGGERTPTLDELQELQERLTKAGFDTGGVDGRIGSDTMRAVRGYQNKVGIEPADGYAGLKVLNRLRGGS